MRHTLFHRATAYHEAGHVVAACRLLRGVTHAGLGDHSRVKGARGTATLRGDYRHHKRLLEGAHTRVTEKNRGRLTEHAFRAMIVGYAGPLAHARQSRKSYAGVLEMWGSADLISNKLIAAHIVPNCAVYQPMGAGALFSLPFLFQLTKPAFSMLERAQDVARQLVSDDWHLIIDVAEKLAARGRLTGDDKVLRRIERVTGKLAT